MEQIRDAALTLRMVQINEVFQRFPRIVRDMRATSTRTSSWS
jgi:two-component system chemotaxis sensor kinase CheA